MFKLSAVKVAHHSPDFKCKFKVRLCFVQNTVQTNSQEYLFCPRYRQNKQSGSDEKISTSRAYRDSLYRNPKCHIMSQEEEATGGFKGPEVKIGFRLLLGSEELRLPYFVSITV